jgi:predicted tellurium resistance membrane protein TerC
MDTFFSAQDIVALLTLVVLEIVLGIDNVIFIAILSSKLPPEQRTQARRLGIGLAVGSRLLLLFTITWVMQLTTPLFTLLDNGISGRDLILLAGGLFLIGKSTYEIHERLEAQEHHRGMVAVATMASVIAQIVLIDVVFSLDSVVTAVGISGNIWVMAPAIIVAAAVMLFFAGRISDFVERHPTMKILALAFLILIGTLLVVEGWNSEAVHSYHLKNYAYFAMAFSLAVELVNVRLRKQSAEPVKLHNQPHSEVAVSSGPLPAVKPVVAVRRSQRRRSGR